MATLVARPGTVGATRDEEEVGLAGAEGVARANEQFAKAAEMARTAMGQMLDMLQSRGKR